MNELAILRGLHPGIVLARKLRDSKISKGKFALSIQEYPQTLGAITKGKRDMNTRLALKIEHSLGLEEGYFMTLQLFYDIQKIKGQKNQAQPDLLKLRPGLFWDTEINKIDWHKQRKAVIQRIIERGTEEEKTEIKRFYGLDSYSEILNNLTTAHG